MNTKSIPITLILLFACVFPFWAQVSGVILDEKGGPNHVGNFCGAPFHFHTSKGELSSGLLLDYIRLIARSVSPGSRLIAYSSYDRDLDVCAFLRPDMRIALILLNTADE